MSELLSGLCELTVRASAVGRQWDVGLQGKNFACQYFHTFHWCVAGRITVRLQLIGRQVIIFSSSIGAPLPCYLMRDVLS